jgi:hypothetical protein
MVDSYNIYRGQDGVIDYVTPVAVMALEDTEIEITAQDLPPNTIWHYERKQIRGDCSLEGEASNPCIIYMDAAGDMRSAAPNPPMDLTAEPIVGGKVRLRWRYSTAGQEAAPAGFAVFQIQTTPFSETPAGIILGGIGLRGEFMWDSDVLTGTWLFMIKAFTMSNGLSLPSCIVMATTDSQGPPAIETLLAEAV